MLLKLTSALVALAFLLSACGLLGGGSEPGATCYPEPEETPAETPAETLTVSEGSSPAYVPGQLLVRYRE